MAYSAGTAFLQVVPSFRNIEKTMRQQVADIGRSIDKSVSGALPAGMKKGLRDIRPAGPAAADEFSGAFARTLHSRLEKAFKSLPEVEIHEDSSDVDKALNRIRRELLELRDQHVLLDIDDATALAAVRRLHRELDEINRSSTNVTVHANTAAASRELRELQRLSENFFDTSGTSKRFEDNFAAQFRKAVNAAAQDLPELPVKVDRTFVDREIEDIRAELVKLGKQDVVGIDIDDRTALGKLEELAQRLNQLHRSAGNDLRVEADTSAALAKIDAFYAAVQARSIAQARAEQQQQESVAKEQAKLDERLRRDWQRAEDRRSREQARQAERDSKEAAKVAAAAAEESLGGFARRFRDQLNTAVSSIRTVDVDTAPAQRRLQELRADLERLRDLHVGVDIDTGTAIAEIKRISAELERLGRRQNDVQVRADIAGAFAALKSVERVADKLDGRRVNIDVDLDQAAKGVDEIAKSSTFTLSRLGALISLGASLGTAIVPGAAAAAVAVGAIGTAAAAGAIGVGVIGLSMFGIADTVKALDKAQNDAGKSAKSLGASENAVANAVDGVASARRSLATAVADAAFAERRSAQTVKTARQQVTDAEKDAAAAQKDLAAAIKEVRQEEEDRALQLRDNALAQRQANLDLAEAKKDLDKIIANPKATEAEREQARITFEERKLQLDKLTVAQKRLKDEQDDANRKGVKGSDQVVAANERIASTQKSVADAQQSLANALEDQQRQQTQSANAIISATENLSQAQRTLQQAYVSSGETGSAALDDLQKKMDALSPAGQRFALFIFGLKDEVLQLRDAAAEGFLPGAQKALTDLLPYLPRARDFIGEVAVALGQVAVQVVQALGNPGWQRFFKFIGSETVPTLHELADVTLNVAAGSRDVFLALTAFNKPIGRGLIDMSESFAKWAAQLNSSDGYRKFLAYVQDVGPDVVDFFFELGRAILHVIEAAAPVGKVVLAILDSILRFINVLPTGVLTTIIVVIAGVSAGMLVLSGVMKAAKAVTELKAAALQAYARAAGVASAAVDRLRISESTSLVGSGQYSKGLGVTTTAVQSLSSAQTATVTSSKTMATGLSSVGSATSKTGAALGGLSAFLGGPWTIALVGAGVALSFVVAKIAEQKAQADENVKAFQRLAEAISKTGNIQSNEAQQTILQSDTLKKLVLDIDRVAKQAGDFDTKLADVAKTHGTLAQQQALAGRAAQDYGTDLDTLAQALIGNKAAQQQLLDTLARASDPQNGGDEKLRKMAAARREELVQLFAQMDLQVKVEDALAKSQRDTNDAFANATPGLQQYVDSLKTLADVSSSAADKSDALRAAEDLLFGSQRSLQESLESQARALRERNKLLTDDNFLNQAGAKTLDIKTEAGARLTDALEAELTAIDDTFRANVAAGKSIEEATRQHDAEVAALRDATAKKGIDSAATENLIRIYGQVPTSRITEFGTNNFDATKAQLDELMAYQLALREGISLDQARAKLNPIVKQPGGRGNPQGGQLATGGPVRGPGTGTSDSVPAWIPETGTPFRLSNGEFVHRAAAVSYYGRDAMKAINERRIPREWLGMGFADGGLLLAALQDKYPFPYNTAATKIPSKADAARAVRENQTSDNLGPIGAGPGFLPWPASPGAQRGDTGVWKSIVNLVRGSGIPYKFGNAFRPGDPLWHGSGRAVDFMGFNQDELANFFLARQNQLLELIHLTPKGGYFVTRGKRKANFAVQGPLHRNHLHVAMAAGGPVQIPQLRAAVQSYDTGGGLPPGYTLAYNGTGQSEQVLTSRQWAEVQMMAKQQAAAGNAYHFQFKDTTLTAARLRAIQDREAVIARTGRAR